MPATEPFSDIAGLTVTEHEPLASYTTFRVGGPARWLLIPTTPDALSAAMKRVRDEGLESFVLGGGTNVLVADAGFDGVVIRIERNLSDIAVSGDVIEVQAGARMPALAALATRSGLAGMEPLAGIPGTVGGAVGINAGAFGSDVSAMVEWVEGFSESGEWRRVDRADIEYGYRRAVYPEPLVFTGARLRFTPDDPTTIGRRAAEIRARRAATQPTRARSAGCAFKNAGEVSAGRSIDEMGLKGFRVGAAAVSTVHANYIVNTGEATADDVRRLIETVRERVHQGLGIELEVEVRMLGFVR